MASNVSPDPSRIEIPCTPPSKHHSHFALCEKNGCQNSASDAINPTMNHMRSRTLTNSLTMRRNVLETDNMRSRRGESSLYAVWNETPLVKRDRNEPGKVRLVPCP